MKNSSFGAVFESTLNPEKRRSGGMHCTSLESIHKVIGPLFLDGLKGELAAIKAVTVERTRRTELEGFQRKPVGLTFLESKVQTIFVTKIQINDYLAA